MNQKCDHIYLGNAEGVSAYKKSYHQLCLNNLIKIESLEFKPYFFFFFLGGGGIFSRCKLIISGPVVLTKSIIFSGNSTPFLDFSYLLSIFFLLDDAFACPTPVVFFFRQPYKINNLDSSAISRFCQ